MNNPTLQEESQLEQSNNLHSTLQKESQFEQCDNLQSTLLDESLSIDSKQLEKEENEAELEAVSFNFNNVLVKYFSRNYVVE